MSDVVETSQPSFSAEKISPTAVEFNQKEKEAFLPPSFLIFRENVTQSRFKRALDLFGASILLTAATPLLFAAMLALLLEDGRPIFFRQRRVGRFGQLFTMYKLRTMSKEKCGDAFSPTSGRDPRITRVGYWLRKTSIDELPQLINIVRGDMTFVGPRPEMPFVVRNYQVWQHLRHLVKPGITGFWQITCRSTVPLHLPQATLLDLDYIQKASYSTDLIVLVKTIRMLISTHGAY